MASHSDLTGADLPLQAAKSDLSALDKARIGLRKWRSKMVGSALFRNRVAALPFGRAHSNNEANGLFQITAGFVNSQILLAATQLGFFDLDWSVGIADAQLKAALGLPENSAQRLVAACHALTFITQMADGRWYLDDRGAVIASNPGIQAMVRHHAMLYRDLADPVALLKAAPCDTQTRNYWAYADPQDGATDSADRTAPYSALMGHSQDLLRDELLAGYSFKQHRHYMDIGGGNGRLISAVGQQYPALKLAVFDLPSVSAQAAPTFEAAGQSARAQIHGGDFFKGPIPSGADVISLVRICCDHEDAQVALLLRNIRQSMVPGAKLLIIEPFADGSAGGRLASAYFNMYFLAMGQGRCRTPAHLTSLLKTAGFARVTQKATRAPLIAGMMIAQTQ